MLLVSFNVVYLGEDHIRVVAQTAAQTSSIIVATTARTATLNERANKDNLMSAVKKMTKEELVQVMRTEQAALRQATTLLTALTAVVSQTHDFTFTGLQQTREALAAIKGTRKSIEAIQRALVLRGKTKVAEECKLGG